MAILAFGLLSPALTSRAAQAESTLDDQRAPQVFGPVQRHKSDGWRTLQDKRLRVPGTSRERTLLPAGSLVQLADQRQIRERGEGHEVQLWEGRRVEGVDGGGFNDEVAVLAVFRAGRAEPIDVAEVKSDRLTWIEQPLLPLGPNDDAFVVVNHHANAGQPYTEASLFHLQQGRLRRVAVVDLLGEMSGCAQAFDEKLDWRTEADGQALPVIVARVVRVLAPKAAQQGCDGKPAAERRDTFEGRWRWDASRAQYVLQGSTLDRLARWNEQRR